MQRFKTIRKNVANLYLKILYVFVYMYFVYWAVSGTRVNICFGEFSWKNITSLVTTCVTFPPLSLIMDSA